MCGHFFCLKLNKVFDAIINMVFNDSISAPHRAPQMEKTMATTEQLIGFIKAHDFDAHATEDGKIAGLMIYCKDGKAYGQWETIEPNARAVRDWLGY